MIRQLKILFLFLTLAGCSVVEPESQNNIVSKAHIPPGPLDSLEFYLSFFNEANGSEFDLTQFRGTVTVIGATSSRYNLIRVGERIFKVNSEGDNISAGEILFLSGRSEGFEISAKTTIPNSPDSLTLSMDFLKLNTQFDGEALFLGWNKGDQFLWVDIQVVGPIQEYPETYIESFPSERSFLRLGSPTDDGVIKMNPWDFQGSGNYELRVFWFGPEGRILYDEPIQSGIFPVGSGIIEGLGYFQGFDSDTFFIQVSF